MYTLYVFVIDSRTITVSYMCFLQCDTYVVIDSGIITVWYLCYYYSVIPVLLLTLEPPIRLYGLCWEVELTQQG